MLFAIISFLLVFLGLILLLMGKIIGWFFVITAFSCSILFIAFKLRSANLYARLFIFIFFVVVSIFTLSIMVYPVTDFLEIKEDYQETNFVVLDGKVIETEYNQTLIEPATENTSHKNHIDP